MKRASLILALMAACAVASGCTVSRHYDSAIIGELRVVPYESKEIEHIAPTAQFNVGNVSNSSGFAFPPDYEDGFDLVDAMKASLQTALGKHTPQDTSKQFAISVDIFLYYPSNIWRSSVKPLVMTALLPIGMVAPSNPPVLSVNVAVRDENGKIYAVFNVHDAINDDIFISNPNKNRIFKFDRVATEIVSVLTNPSEKEKLVRDYSKEMIQPEWTQYKGRIAE